MPGPFFPPDAPRWAQPDRVFEVETIGAPARGPDDAPVRLVEFGDFRCRYCKTMLPILDRIRETYPNQLRLLFKHFPVVSEASWRAAIAAVAAQRQGKFWEMHDVLFELQDQALTEPVLRRYARGFGIDAERFSADLRSPEVEAVVRADFAEADRIGISGTPAFFINGRYLQGSQSYPSLKQVIDRELNSEEAARPLLPAAPPQHVP